MTSRYSHDETVVLNIHHSKDDVEPTPVPGRKWRSVVAAAGIAASAGALSVAYMMSTETPQMHVETQSLEQKLDIEPTVSATLTGVSFETLDADSNGIIDNNDLTGYLGPIYGPRIKEVLSSDLDEDIKKIKTELINSVYTRQLDCWTAELASQGDVTSKTYPDFQDVVATKCPASAFEPSTLDYELPQVDAVEEAPTLTAAMDVVEDAPEAAALDGAPPAPPVDDLLNPTASNVISFDTLDSNRDQVVDDREITSYLDDYFQSILSQVQMDASLSDDMKTLKTNLIKQQYETQSHCLEATINRFKEHDAIITPETFPLFEVMMGELCPPGVLNKDVMMDQTISKKGAQDEQSTIKEDVPPPTEEEVVEEVLGNAPQVIDHFDIAQQESNDATSTFEEAPATTEEDNTPVNDPEVVAEEQKADEVEDAAEAGNDAAVEEVEQHEDAVEDAAESGSPAAVAEEEHHEAQVEQAAEEGNEAAIKEEEHFQEQVEEATADAPPAVKEEEQAVQETEQAAESGDETAVEEVEQKQDELVEEAEEGNPEAAQEEEHLEVVEEQAANDGNAAAEEIVDHHEEEVQQTEEAATTTEETSSVAENDSNQESEGTAGDDTADIIQDLGGYDDNESPVEAGDKNWMTKEEFRQKLADHFQKESEYLDEVAAKAEEEYNQLSNHIQRLDDCIEQASNKFGWYGVYEEAPHYDNAVDWVANVCLQEGSN